MNYKMFLSDFLAKLWHFVIDSLVNWQEDSFVSMVKNLDSMCLVYTFIAIQFKES